MTFPFFHYNAEQEPPFTVFVEHHDQTRDGHWRPEAFVMLTPRLRTSGFLLALSPEELQSFLLLLTFITADGRIAPATSQLAQTLGTSEAKTRARLERLLKVEWLGQHIVTKNDSGAGWHSYSPVLGLLPFREEEEVDPPQAVYRVAPRKVIIEHSRRTYARPRAEVEREIEQFFSKSSPSSHQSHKPSHSPMTYQSPTPQNEASNQLRDALIQVGVYAEQADELLVDYDHVRIQRQLMWLPYRGARNSAGFLIAAIRDNYEAPIALQKSQSAEDEVDIDTTALNVSDAE